MQSLDVILEREVIEYKVQVITIIIIMTIDCQLCYHREYRSRRQLSRVYMSTSIRILFS
jgi:hypothetical protein